MNLSPYLETVRNGLTNAASLADESTQHVAQRLGTAVESSTRLALIQALSDAAGVISADLAPSSVELRLSGEDPEFVVTTSTSAAEPTLLRPEPERPSGDESDAAEADEDEPLARISLRLPASVKARVDEQASKDGISTNAWLVRAIMDALADRGAGGTWPLPPPPPPPSGGSFFGPNGPFGPHGVFGPGSAHHVHHPEFGRSSTEPANEHHRGRPGGSVQGWAR